MSHSSAQKPECLPNSRSIHFQRPSEDDHQGVPTSLRTVFTQTHRSSTPEPIYPASPGDARRWHHLQNHARYRRQNPTRNYPSSSKWSTQCLFNTTTYLSSTRPPSSWTQTAASVTSLWTTVSPCRRHTFCFQCSP
jgi:hypothetical protein